MLNPQIKHTSFTTEDQELVRAYIKARQDNDTATASAVRQQFTPGAEQS